MPKEVRADLHERVADWATALDRDTELDELVGYHLERIPLPGGDRPARRTHARAWLAGGRRYLGRAGQRAFARDDMPAAVKLLDRALALVTKDEPLIPSSCTSSAQRCSPWARSRAPRSSSRECSMPLRRRTTAGWSGRRCSSAPPAAAIRTLMRASSSTSRCERSPSSRSSATTSGSRVPGAEWRPVTRTPVGCGPRKRPATTRWYTRAVPEMQEEARTIDRLCTVFVLGPAPAELAIARVNPSWHVPPPRSWRQTWSPPSRCCAL